MLWAIAIGLSAYLGLLVTLRYEQRNGLSGTPKNTLKNLPLQDEQLQATLQRYPMASLSSQPGTTSQPSSQGTSSNNPVVVASSSSSSGNSGTTSSEPATQNMGIGVASAPAASSGFSESGSAPSGGIGVASG